MSELSNRLRLASMVTDDWDSEILPPPVHDWAVLMEEAADALEALESDLEEPPARLEATQAVE